MFCIPSVKILFFDIDLLKAIEDSILSLAAESLPFKSDIGLVSAKPNYLALSRISWKFLFLLSIEERIKLVVPLRIP